jgi:predicted nucleic acid-binding protein
LKFVCDSGPLIAAAARNSRQHATVAALIEVAGRDAVVPDVVLVEADYMIRTGVGSESARRLLAAAGGGALTTAFLTPGLLERAVELDALYADLDLGLVDTSIMAYAERHDLPILTFDFRHFRATESIRGPWRLVMSEEQLSRARRR